MGKKVKKHSFSFMNTEPTSSSSLSWPWPSCGSPKTLSFRVGPTDIVRFDRPPEDITGGESMEAVIQGLRSSERLFFEPGETNSILEEAKKEDGCPYKESVAIAIESRGASNAERLFLNSIVEEAKKGDRCPYTESVAIAIESGDPYAERLFLEPGETNSILEEAKKYECPYKESVAIANSILEEEKKDDGCLYKESVAIAMESQDPYVDFKKSMEEMVVAHGLRDWECLEELLGCYLRVNGKNNHGYIVGAFVDLLVGLAFDSSCLSSSSGDHSFAIATTTNSSPTSPLSFTCSTSSTSPCLSSLEEVEDETQKIVDTCSSTDSSDV